MHSEQDLKNAQEYRREIHEEALARVRAVYPCAENIIDKYPAEAYFQEMWDYPGQWYTVVGIPSGAGSRKDLVCTLVCQTLEYCRNAGAVYSDDEFFRIIAQYPNIPCDYCLINSENQSAKANGVFPYREAASHRLALECAAVGLLKKGKGIAFDIKGAKCRKLSNKAIFAPINSDEWLNYRKAFLNPAHGNSCNEKDFERINAALFPADEYGLEAYRWMAEAQDNINKDGNALCLTVYDKNLERFVVITSSGCR